MIKFPFTSKPSARMNGEDTTEYVLGFLADPRVPVSRILHENDGSPEGVQRNWFGV